MRSTTVRTAFVAVILAWLSAYSPAAEEAVFRTRRLGPRVLLLTENSPMENIVVALASRRGLVVIDACPSLATAAEARKIITAAFGRSDFLYVVLTHGHWDHASGAAAFPGAGIVAHEQAVPLLRQEEKGRPESLQRFRQRIDELTRQIAALPPDSPDRPGLMQQLAFTRRNAAGRQEAQAPARPAITFRDRVTLDLGDLSLELTWFGNAHSGSDVFVRIPEEKLLVTGDVFLDRGWLPLFAGQPRLDIPRWIEVLHDALDGPGRPDLVIPGHREPWATEKLVLWRDYIATLWTEVQAARKAGETLAALQARLPLGPKYDYLKGLGHAEARLQRFQADNLRAFWNQLFVSAALLVETTLQQQGLEAALQQYDKLRASGDPELLFDERQFNNLGYRLLEEGKLPAALAVFERNAAAFPSSANAWDSLGEALERAGRKEEALRRYRRSLELNPANDGTRRAVERLAAQP